MLIADSGATKTEWRLEGTPNNQKIVTEGLNPYYHTADSIAEILKRDLIPKIETATVDKIFFYGAGCDGPAKNKIVEKALLECFSDSGIHIYHDLLGAARACCMDDSGIACILGTGSNSCLYNGEKIINHIPSLAFILGDEASAGYFGKKLINAYFRKELPEDLKVALERNYNMDLDYIMKQLYKETQFSRFIASYGAFLGENADHPFIEKMLREGFENFITRIVKKYSGASSLKTHFIGSVACAHKDLVKEVLSENNLQAGHFIQNPMERLVEFHSR